MRFSTLSFSNWTVSEKVDPFMVCNAERWILCCVNTIQSHEVDPKVAQQEMILHCANTFSRPEFNPEVAHQEMILHCAKPNCILRCANTILLAMAFTQIPNPGKPHEWKTPVSNMCRTCDGHVTDMWRTCLTCQGPSPMNSLKNSDQFTCKTLRCSSVLSKVTLTVPKWKNTCRTNVGHVFDTCFFISVQLL